MLSLKDDGHIPAPETVPRGGSQGRQVHAQDFCGPRDRRQETGQQVQECGLTGAAGTDDEPVFAALDPPVQLFQNRSTTVTDCRGGQLDRWNLPWQGCRLGLGGHFRMTVRHTSSRSGCSWRQPGPRLLLGERHRLLSPSADLQKIHVASPSIGNNVTHKATPPRFGPARLPRSDCWHRTASPAVPKTAHGREFEFVKNPNEQSGGAEAVSISRRARSSGSRSSRGEPGSDQCSTSHRIDGRARRAMPRPRFHPPQPIRARGCGRPHLVT